MGVSPRLSFLNGQPEVKFPKVVCAEQEFLLCVQTPPRPPPQVQQPQLTLKQNDSSLNSTSLTPTVKEQPLSRERPVVQGLHHEEVRK